MSVIRKHCVYPGCTWSQDFDVRTLWFDYVVDRTCTAHLNDAHPGWTEEEVRAHAADRERLERQVLLSNAQTDWDDELRKMQEEDG